MTRLLLQALFLLASVLLVAPTVVASDQEEAPVKRIVAIGDLHGDFEAWQEIANAAGLIGEDGEWAGGDTILVQLGDLTDRGPDSLKIIRQLQALEKEAPGTGGKVTVLIGNHEAMNVIGDLRYVHPGEYEAFRDRRSKRRRDATWAANRERLEAAYAAFDPPVSAKEAKTRWYEATPLGMLEHRRAWQPGGELAEWVQSLPAVAQVGDTLFVHGGLSWERGQRPLSEINAQISSALSAGNSINREALEDPFGPLWYRGNVVRGPDDGPDRASIDDELTQILAFHNAARLVVGHTPSRNGIQASNGGRLLRVDTGISAHYGGPLSYLEIAGERVIAYQKMAGANWTKSVLAGVEP